MLRKLSAIFGAIVLSLGAFAGQAAAQSVEPRIALVIGNAAYQTGALNTPANDAGLIAQSLQAAGFDVSGARDLDQDSLRRAVRDFLDKAAASGPNTVAVMYLSGYGLQLEGENYFVPIDAKIARDSDVAAEALRLSDYTRPLAALPLKNRIVIVDAARAHPFAKQSAPLASGLALVEPDPGMLIAFNAAPGTVAPEGKGAYGPYAQALAEMIREGGLSLPDVFNRTRLRVNEITKGAEVPWYASRAQGSFVFFERAPDAPPPQVSNEQTQAIRTRPIRDFDAQDAYAAALERDTLDGYLDFLAAYPNDPMAKRVHAIVAARREAITWRRTRSIDTPPAYWSYLRRYPRGPHVADARRRLAFLTAELEPPPSFEVIVYDVPPPPPEEIIYIERPILIFDDPYFAFAPPPPPRVIFIAPPPPEFIVLAPPPPPVFLFVLPIPVYTPVPVWVRPPLYVAPPPPNNVIFANIHNTVVINNQTNTVVVTDRTGQSRTLPPPTPAPSQSRDAGRPGPGTNTPATPASLIGPALPPSVAQKAALLPPGQPSGQPSRKPGPGGITIPPGTPAGTPPGTGRALPGATTPLPGVASRPPGIGTTPGSAPGRQGPADPSHQLPTPDSSLANRTPPGTAPGSKPGSDQRGPQTGKPLPGSAPSLANRPPATTLPQTGTPPKVDPSLVNRTPPSTGPGPDRGGPPSQTGTPPKVDPSLVNRTPPSTGPGPDRRGPPPPQIDRTAPPPTLANRPPPGPAPSPPQIERRAPPPPVVTRPPPPPPPPVVTRAPPPPPPQAARPTPPAQQAGGGGGKPSCPAGKTAVMVNGQQQCR